jgi:hypothetical protein
MSEASEVQGENPLLFVIWIYVRVIFYLETGKYVLSYRGRVVI